MVVLEATVATEHFRADLALQVVILWNDAAESTSVGLLWLCTHHITTICVLVVHVFLRRCRP